jgi:2-succinyl-5-enolpyruvyl-6-hydroxy-3-cyclohexene-1-carboxylate synthase
MQLDLYQPNDLAGALAASTLNHLGLSEVVISPGSRSTPLTAAFAEHPSIHCHVILDERSAAFYALGISKRKQLPTILVCTSGTAVANYLPAVIEAYHTQTPLLVFSADRPPMLQDCAAGQTIYQPGIFGRFTSWNHQVALPENNERYLRYLRETLKHAFDRSIGLSAGPVHLNFPFDDPLTPKNFGESFVRLSESLSTAFHLDSRYGDPFSITDSQSCGSLPEVDSSTKVLIVAGPSYLSKNEAVGSILVELCTKLDAAVFTDVLGPWRHIRELEPWRVDAYDVLCRSDSICADLKPDLVIQVGDLPTSKALRAALELWQTPTIGVSAGKDRTDPTNRSFVFKTNHLETLIRCGIDRRSQDDATNEYPNQWRKHSGVILETYDENLSNNAEVLDEFSLCREVLSFVKSDCDLYIGNSMIVRDMEQFLPPSQYVNRVYSNRGTSGIDGQLSTAFGCIENERPMISFVGDLTLLHDIGGLACANQTANNRRMLLIVLDNKGGGIFEHLPIAQCSTVFEPYFGTPQKANIQALVEGYGLAYRKPDSLENLGEIIIDFFNSRSSAKHIVAHIETDRKKAYQSRISLKEELDLALKNSNE